MAKNRVNTHETREMNDSIRSVECHNGSFTKLSKGVTHYELLGDSGDIVLLVHGASLASWIWDKQIDVLLSNGFRVLRYDEYGRGYSDYLITDYNIELYSDQLLELLDYLNIDENIHIVGHSFGGMITSYVTSKKPNMFKSVTLVAPGIKTTLLENIVTSTFLGRWVVHHKLKRIPKDIDSILEDVGVDLVPYKEYYLNQWVNIGYEYSVLSLFRNAVGNYLPFYENLTTNNIPSQLIKGSRDKLASGKYIKELQALVPSLKVTILDANHAPQFEKYDEFNNLLLEFLLKNSK
jgi:pimeloyl-ACP methyl ester carboxylesterase